MVMIKKKLEVALVDSLCTILLREADNNFHSGVFFGGRVMDHACKIGFILEEQMADKQCTAKDGTFQKLLNYDYTCLC